MCFLLQSKQTQKQLQIREICVCRPDTTAGWSLRISANTLGNFLVISQLLLPLYPLLPHAWPRCSSALSHPHNSAAGSSSTLRQGGYLFSI